MVAKAKSGRVVFPVILMVPLLLAACGNRLLVFVKPGLDQTRIDADLRACARGTVKKAVNKLINERERVDRGLPRQEKKKESGPNADHGQISDYSSSAPQVVPKGQLAMRPQIAAQRVRYRQVYIPTPVSMPDVSGAGDMGYLTSCMARRGYTAHRLTPSETEAYRGLRSQPARTAYLVRILRDYYGK